MGVCDAAFLTSTKVSKSKQGSTQPSGKFSASNLEILITATLNKDKVNVLSLCRLRFVWELLIRNDGDRKLLIKVLLKERNG